MTRTYIDAGVLIAASRGKLPLARSALQILDDPNRHLILSDAVRLEVFPKAIYEKRDREVRFYEEVFRRAEVEEWSEATLKEAYRLACEYGIGAMDAMHLAFAIAAGAEELVTTEQETKPLFRFNQENPKRKPRVRSLLSSA